MNNTMENFAFCLIMTDADAASMTEQDADYNITEWKNDGVEMPEGMTAAALVETLRNVMDCMKGDI